MPGHEQYGSAPAGGVPGQPGGGMPGGQWGSQPGSRSPVNEAETRVTWRRIFQYWIDAFLVSIVPYLVSIPFDRSSRTSLHVIGGIVTFVLFLAIGIWYWIIRPQSHNGQTFAMQWFGLRVISKDGGPASTAAVLHPLDQPDLRRVPVGLAVHRPAGSDRHALLALPAAHR